MKPIHGLLLFLAMVVYISCGVTSSGQEKIEIKLSGVAVKYENDQPLKDVKVLLFRTRPGFFRAEEERISETLTDSLGRFSLAATVPADECGEWSYYVNAWLYIVRRPDNVPRQIRREISIQCSDTPKELMLRLRK